MSKPKTLCKKCDILISNNNIKKHNEVCKGSNKLSCFIRKANNLHVNLPCNQKIILEEQDWKSIQQTYDGGARVADICKQYNLSFLHMALAAKLRLFVPRTRHETAIMRGTYKSHFRDNEDVRWVRKTYLRLDSYGEQAVLESKLEVRFADICDSRKIKWQKCKSFLLSNKKRYTPDFYLPDHNLYTDPKSEFWIRHFKSKQHDKIALFEKEYNTRCLVLWSKDINEWENLLLEQIK